MKTEREKWADFQQNTPAQRLVFLDETGAKTNMTRLYGRAKDGERCNDHAPDGRWERVSLISALGLSGEVASMVFDGALDTKTYDAYIEHFFGNYSVESRLSKNRSCGVAGQGV